MEFPFDKSSITDNRFHGLFQGTVSIDQEKRLILNTNSGPIYLLQYGTKGHSRNAFWWLRKVTKAGKDSVVNVYGYPKTDYEGIVTQLVLMSFFWEGSNPSHGGINYKFNPGQMFLCGRVRQVNKDGMIAVKVKANKPNPKFRFCYINGRTSSDAWLNSKTLFMAWTDDSLRLQLQPIQVITPPGMKTTRTLKMTAL